MKKFLQVLMFLGLAAALATAQQTPARNKIYKVNFLVYELEDGKRINERTYTLPVTTMDGNPRNSSIAVGDRVPITVRVHEKEEEIQYIDTGLDLECNVTEQNEKFVVNSTITLSSVVALDQGGNQVRGGGDPVVRQIKQRFTTLVAPGKPTLVTSIDDVNSKKKLQVEVTATRLE